ncbi:FeoA family protein [Parerythrobacter jejuensis]|uniref:Ferrous iron transport protein A n=1 Tax=Parerythrobacter jejuensis TaxID=795812 RepID=A0A845AX35_9SPHN|nr:FeoA family protein [Parerythrobacter jejuensis]MXP31374.1 ferrous iron transport protein A [Parerythrobacter jejuensis]MXP34134.1 ferrous iron transport protein A [Parerythrobacter jejuensis]
MTLDLLESGCHATISTINWEGIAVEDGKRLRALGFDEGAQVSIAHRGVFGGRDPLAITLGRMTVAIRRVHAAAVSVTID